MYMITALAVLLGVYTYLALHLVSKYRSIALQLTEQFRNLQSLYEEKDTLADERQATILKRDARIRALESNLDSRAKERDRVQAALEKAEADLKQMKYQFDTCARNRTAERKALEDKLEHCEIFRQTVTPHIERQDALIETLEREKAELQAALEQQHKDAMLQENHLADEIQRLKTECGRLASVCEQWKAAVNEGAAAYDKIRNAVVDAHIKLTAVIDRRH